MKLFNILNGAQVKGYPVVILHLEGVEVIVREEDIQFLTWEDTKLALDQLSDRAAGAFALGETALLDTPPRSLSARQQLAREMAFVAIGIISNKLAQGNPWQLKAVEDKVIHWAMGLKTLEIDDPYIDIGSSRVRIVAKCSYLPMYLRKIYEEEKRLIDSLGEDIKKVSPKVTNLIAGFNFRTQMEMWFLGSGDDEVLILSKKSSRYTNSFENAGYWLDRTYQHVMNVWSVFGKAFVMLEKYIPDLDDFLHDTEETLWKIKTPGLGEYLLKNDLSSWQDQKGRYRAIISIVENWEKMSELIKPLKLKEAVELIKSQIYYQGQMKNTELAKAMANCGVPEEYAQSFGVTWLYGHIVPSIYPNQEKFLKDGYTGQFLSRNDPTGLLLGSLTDCCQQIGSAGENCALNGAVGFSSGFFVIRNPKGVVIAQSWVWATDNGFCFDNIECRDGAWDPETKVRVYDIIRNIYSQAARCLISLWGGKVTIGKGYSDKGLLSKYKKDQDPLVPNSFPESAYRDSNSQVILAEYGDGSMDLARYVEYVPYMLIDLSYQQSVSRGVSILFDRMGDILKGLEQVNLPVNESTKWVLENSPWLKYDPEYLLSLMEM